MPVVKITDQAHAKLKAIADARHGGNLAEAFHATLDARHEALGGENRGAAATVEAEHAARKANTAAAIAAAGKERPEAQDQAFERLGPDGSASGSAAGSSSSSSSGSTSTTVAPKRMKGAMTNPLKRWSRDAASRRKNGA